MRRVGSRCESFQNEINKGKYKMKQINCISTTLTERVLALNHQNYKTRNLLLMPTRKKHAAEVMSITNRYF